MELKVPLDLSVPPTHGVDALSVKRSCQWYVA